MFIVQRPLNIIPSRMYKILCLCTPYSLECRQSCEKRPPCHVECTQYGHMFSLVSLKCTLYCGKCPPNSLECTQYCVNYPLYSIESMQYCDKSPSYSLECTQYCGQVISNYSGKYWPTTSNSANYLAKDTVQDHVTLNNGFCVRSLLLNRITRPCERRLLDTLIVEQLQLQHICQ